MHKKTSKKKTPTNIHESTKKKQKTKKVKTNNKEEETKQTHWGIKTTTTAAKTSIYFKN